MTNSPLTLDRPLIAPSARYRSDPLRGEHQLIYPEGVLVLNETAAAIVRRCDGRSLAELIDSLREQFPGADLSEDVRAFLRRLSRKGLLRDARGP